MPSYLTAALRHDSFHAMAQGAARHDGWRAKTPWPVNEIVLQSLVLGGKNNAEIADRFGVSTDEVAGLRQTYGL